MEKTIETLVMLADIIRHNKGHIFLDVEHLEELDKLFSQFEASGNCVKIYKGQLYINHLPIALFDPRIKSFVLEHFYKSGGGVDFGRIRKERERAL